MTEFKPVKDKFLLPNQRLALQFKEGWTFHRILGVEITRIVDHAENITPIAAGGSLATIDLENSTSDRIFDVTEKYANKMLIHGGIGLKTEDVRVYKEYPLGEKVGRIPSFTPRTDGDAREFVTARDSPSDEPTEALEFICPYTYDVGLSFYNKGDATKWPVLDFLIAKYQMEVLKPTTGWQKELIGRIARGQTPAYMFTIGRVENPVEYNDGLNRWWGVEPVKLVDAQKY